MRRGGKACGLAMNATVLLQQSLPESVQIPRIVRERRRSRPATIGHQTIPHRWPSGAGAFGVLDLTTGSRVSHDIGNGATCNEVAEGLKQQHYTNEGDSNLASGH